MANVIYNNFLDRIADKVYDMTNDVLKLVLLDDGHTPNAAHVYYSDISGDELSDGNGYDTGGLIMTGVTWTQAAGTATFDAANPQFLHANFTSGYAVAVNTTVSNELITLIDYTENKQAKNITFEIRFHVDGIFGIQQM